MSQAGEIGSDHVGHGEPFGVALRARLPLTRDETASVLGQIGHALVAAHAAGGVHGALSVEHVFVTYEEGELFARVFGFELVVDDYRHMHDDIADLSALATEIVGPSPPNGFGTWRAKCVTERWTMAECVTELRALFPAPSAGASVGTGSSGSTRRFERGVPRRDRRVARVTALDRIGRRVLFAALLGGAVGVVLAFVARGRTDERRSAGAPTQSLSLAARTSPPVGFETNEPPRATLDVLSADRASCPDRLLADPLRASREGAHRCVRAVLYQRVLERGEKALKSEERAALKNSCAALADLGCELRVAP